jgi:hypothetical protein
MTGRTESAVHFLIIGLDPAHFGRPHGLDAGARIAYPRAHFAKRGCFAARIERP